MDEVQGEVCWTHVKGVVAITVLTYILEAPSTSLFIYPGPSTYKVVLARACNCASRTQIMMLTTFHPTPSSGHDSLPLCCPLLHPCSLTPPLSGGPGKGMHSRLYTRVLTRYAWAHSCTAFNSTCNHSGLVGIQSSCEPQHVPDMLNVMCMELEDRKSVV